MRNENTMKYVISALLGVGLFGFLYIIMEVITFYSFPRMLGSIAVALIGGGAIGTILQRLPDKDEKNAWKYYVVCFTVMAVIAFTYVTLVDY
ncbi:hypothetical protein [Salinicoccus kekensis]|uniref:Uncharacterized protein n=1 Tax=Salinicoccus kekensis TaxID=714307 RepID=A0A285UJ31_9STAP|nr:hypothetical protein [Salinicoccus kekensis]SOC40606.1 hypothetical protein SAMN05878391_1023 [Salinicoccus kekensis]